MAVFRKPRQGKWIAWLALAALWLTLGMPVVSRSLPAGMASMDLGASCTGHGPDDHHRQAPGEPSAPTDACGYCSLFCHSPLIAGDAGLAPLSCSLAAQSPRAVAVVAGPTPRVAGARSRGPPSLG